MNSLVIWFKNGVTAKFEQVEDYKEYIGVTSTIEFDYFGRKPVFCASRKFAKEYWSEKLANEDIEKLNRAESPRARTLAVRLDAES